MEVFTGVVVVVVGGTVDCGVPPTLNSVGGDVRQSGSAPCESCWGWRRWRRWNTAGFNMVINVKLINRVKIIFMVFVINF